ncbi:MAG: hypothetical protein LUI87_13780 [Lachnospiraceae bacterium]|nr:hypothetical protein [Lachnospiraceae bacterium]
MNYFGLQLEESKSRLIEFGRFVEIDRRQKESGEKRENWKRLLFWDLLTTIHTGRMDGSE